MKGITPTKRYSWVPTTLLLVLTIITLVSCGPTPAPTQPPVEPTEAAPLEPTAAVEPTEVPPTEVPPTEAPAPKVLYLSSNEAPKSLNPFLSDSVADQEALFYVHCRLGQFSPDQTVVPYLADWDQSEDGLTYIFHINDDAKWHDGEPVTAKDVVFTYKLVAHPDSGAVYFGRIEAIKGAKAFHDGEADDVEGLKIVDDKTVQITLEAPSPSFLALSQGSIFLLPEHILGSFDVKDIWDAPYWRNPVGCGPYKWDEYVTDQYIHYEKFPDFFLGEPKIDEIYMRLGTEETNAVSFEKGEVDIVQLAGTDYERFEEMGVTLHKGPGSVENMLVNCRRQWLSDVTFRKALLYAIDREALVEAAWFGYSDVAPNPSVTPWALSPNITEYTYNPEKAKELLEEVGWDGSIEFDLLLGTGAAYRERMTLIIQQNLADVDIKINIVMIEGATRNERLSAGDYDMSIIGYGSMSRTPQAAADCFTSAALPPDGINWSWYEDPELDALFAKAAVEMDPDARTQIFYQITERTTDQLPMLPLIVNEKIIAQSDRVHIPKLAYVPRNRPGKNAWLTWNVYEWDIVE